MPLSPIPEILDELRAGRVIVLVDDENRENEGDFVCAAEKITPELINFMTRVAGGYLCVPLTGADCDRLDLTPQSTMNNSLFGTPFTVSIDGHPKHGVGTGVSAMDRTKTIRMIIDPNSTIDDFVRPGHINPLCGRDGGVLVRTGQTEGSIDLCRLAGLHPSSVIIEICKTNGEMARMPDLEVLCGEHDLKMCSVEQVIQFRLEQETLVERMSPAEGTTIHTPEGEFNLIAYHSAIDPLPHVALTAGGVGQLNGSGTARAIENPVIVRVHRRDLLGDVFGELSNPTSDSLRASLRMIQRAGQGAVIYLRPEGHGEDLSNRLLQIRRPAAFEDVNVPDLTNPNGVGAQAQPMDEREFGIGGQILRDLGLRRLRVLTNHPKKLRGLSGFGLEIVEQLPIEA